MYVHKYLIDSDIRSIDKFLFYKSNHISRNAVLYHFYFPFNIKKSNRLLKAGYLTEV